MLFFTAIDIFISLRLFRTIEGQSVSVSPDCVSELVLVLYGCLRVYSKGLQENAYSREVLMGPGRPQRRSQCV